jgi:SAM-dependent methyltransferase
MSTDFKFREHCPSCEATASRVLLKVPFSDPDIRRAMEELYAKTGRYDAARVEDAVFELRECNACGLVFQSNVPGDALMRDLYEMWHDENKTLTRWTENVDITRRLEISREVALAWNLARSDRVPLRILDYGCGMGLWGGTARAFGAEVWAVEYSASRRAHCEEIGLRMCDDCDLPMDYFDYIHVDQVLEHVEHPRALVSKLARHLRFGGVICIAVPQGTHLKRALNSWRNEVKRLNLGRLNPVVPLLHLNCFTQRNLTMLASQFGLSRIRPSWQALWPMWAWPPGMTAKLRCFARPFYIRGGRTTRVFLSRALRHASVPLEIR